MHRFSDEENVNFNKQKCKLWEKHQRMPRDQRHRLVSLPLLIVLLRFNCELSIGLEHAVDGRFVL